MQSPIRAILQTVKQGTIIFVGVAVLYKVTVANMPTKVESGKKFERTDEILEYLKNSGVKDRPIWLAPPKKIDEENDDIKERSNDDK